MRDDSSGYEHLSSRRLFLGGALGAAGLVAAGGAGFGIARADNADPEPDAAAAVPFYGVHQAGIATAQQDRLAFAAFDVTSTEVNALRTMLAQWSAAAAQVTAGKPVGAVETAPESPPIDTGEAMGLPPSRLTITVGFGPSLFDERFGLAERRPAALAALPHLPGDDALEPGRSGGDLCVQACANDPTVAFHVIRNFARLARGTAVLRWSQLGFGRTSSTSTTQETPRNLMLIESWDTDYLADQEKVFGRVKDSGAPLTGTSEFDTPNLSARKGGQFVIDLNAHIRLAAPSSNHDEHILRRGYSYTDGIDPRTGLLDAGLFFIGYQKDPRRQFVPIQARLGQHDLLNEYIRHTGSALFAVPPGLAAAGDYFGKQMLAA